ncbi:hypothetical protein DFH27DRAFT_575463 [Peziza echinospora]|nr:hypothetical protein DFH27DRAFT_575463 [Peziza echinospora]
MRPARFLALKYLSKGYSLQRHCFSTIINHATTTNTAGSMARLTPASIQAIQRLRAYRPKETSFYEKMPLSRRAAVLILLFPDMRGDLRVVLTLRSQHLRNFAGHVALPGGKADDLNESAFETARREAYEEIGLPLPTHSFILSKPTVPELQSLSPVPAPMHFSITHLTELPCSLSRTNLAVRPCIALLLPSKPTSGNGVKSGGNGEEIDFNVEINVDIESLLIPRLDPKEVSAVFSVPLESFLSKTYAPRYLLPTVTPTTEGIETQPQSNSQSQSQSHLKDHTDAIASSTNWYRGEKHNWFGKEWVMHEFMAPVWSDRAVVAGEGTPIPGIFDDKRIPPEEAALLLRAAAQKTPSSLDLIAGKTVQDEVIEKELRGEGCESKGVLSPTEGGAGRNVLRHYRVWGMTSRILLDAARIAYGRDPEFECLEEVGDEGLIGALWEHGAIRKERFQGEDDVIAGALREKREKGNL